MTACRWGALVRRDFPLLCRSPHNFRLLRSRPIMTGHSPDNTEIRNVEDFEAALGRLMLAALDSDIDPYGSRAYRTDDGTADVEVMVFELAEQDAS